MHRSNNFDFLRLVLASFVIITHAYPLSGESECDFLCQISNGQLSFSYIGVKGFFVISGYLIFQSLERSKTVFNYYWKRILRLFPALIIVLLLTVLLAPFVYENSLTPYFLNKQMWSYIPNNLSLYLVQYHIDGVFEENPYKGTINGSLWTIRYEFTMYILVSFFIIVSNKVKLKKLMLGSMFIILVFLNLFFMEYFQGKGFIVSAEQLLDLGVFFIAGSFLASIKFEELKNYTFMSSVAFIILIVSLFTDSFYAFTYFLFPILILAFGLNSTPYLKSIGKKLGDISYGIYIYAFPVQQTLYYFFKLNYIESMIYGFLVSAILGYASWHLIEKRALKWKNKI